MPQRVYIETTIPSCYYDERQSLAARCLWTRAWWDDHRHEYELATSAAVLAELVNGDHPLKAAKIPLLNNIQQLSLDDEVLRIAETYVREFVMPKEPIADALHLALASYHRCDVLLTWNCAHLANARKYGHIRGVNEKLGLHVPVITTPLQLMDVDLDES
jgi:hypothetical protein